MKFDFAFCLSSHLAVSHLRPKTYEFYYKIMLQLISFVLKEVWKNRGSFGRASLRVIGFRCRDAIKTSPVTGPKTFTMESSPVPFGTMTSVYMDVTGTVDAP